MEDERAGEGCLRSVLPIDIDSLSEIGEEVGHRFAAKADGIGRNGAHFIVAHLLPFELKGPFSFVFLPDLIESVFDFR